MAFNYDNYLRTDKMPTLWCWGCGDGVILKALIRAIDKLGWDMNDVCVVSGIGCSGRFSSYINCNTVHTTHGRAIAYATGIKLANPDKHVIVVTGDGDGLAIGGNHTIHGCRRNINLNHVLINNFIYGLTNSQTSPTTPTGFWTVTVRGGPTKVDIILSEREIFYPYANEGEIEFMLATAQVSFEQFKDGVKEGGIIVVEPNLVRASDEDKKRWKIYEIPIISIAKDEVGNVITQSVVALAVAVQMSGCLDTELVKRVMLSKVPKKVYGENEKAYELGIKYAKICIENDK